MVNAHDDSATCFLFSFLESDFPNKPATKLFLRLMTLVEIWGFSAAVGGPSSALVGGVMSPARFEVLKFEKD